MENKSFYFKWNGFKGFRKKYLLEFINNEIKFEMSESFEHRLQIYTRLLILTLIEKKESGITLDASEQLLKRCGLENQQRHIEKIHWILRFIDFILKETPITSINQIFALHTKENPQFEIKKADHIIFRINKNIIEESIIKDSHAAEKFYQTFNTNILSKYMLWNEEMPLAINPNKMEVDSEITTSTGVLKNSTVSGVNTSNIESKNPMAESINYDSIKTLGKNEINELDQFRVKVSEFTNENEDVGFGVLRGNNWCYYIKKLYCIIGRAPVKYGVAMASGNQNSLTTNYGNTTWHVDVDLGQHKKISKQHVLIVYNFQTCAFEIKNLSKKYPVKLNGEVLKYNEEMPLTSKSSIIVGNQEFYFLLPL
jgi:hypothetical protein